MLKHEDIQEDEMRYARHVRICFEDDEYDYSTTVNGTRQEVIDHFSQGPVDVGDGAVEVMEVPLRIEFHNCGKFEDEIIVAEI